LVLGVVLVAFPLYITFIAPPHTAQEIVQVPMPLLPGSHSGELQAGTAGAGQHGAASTAPVAPHDVVSLVRRWSSPSARSPSRCCRRLRSSTSAFRCACSSSG
jgi:ABC-type glycerol-3-phosphate transport system permease component